MFETSAALFDLGVIDGNDMTLEAAYTKMLWVLAAYTDPVGRKQDTNHRLLQESFQREYCGEMSSSIFSARWRRDLFDKATDSDYLIGNAHPSMHGLLRAVDISEAFIRIEGLALPAGLESAKICVFMGEPPRPTEMDPLFAANLLAEFSQVAPSSGEVDRNLNVSHTLPKIFAGGGAVSLSFGLIGARGLIDFKAVRLVVYTKVDPRRDRA